MDQLLQRMLEFTGAGMKDGTALQQAAVAQQRQTEQAHLAQKLASLGLLAGGLAHDFNNILTAILGNISLVRLSPQALPPEIAELLNEVEHAALRGKDMTQQLLNFARGGAPVKQPLPLDTIVRESAEFAVRGSPTGVDFAFAPDLWPVDVDPLQISQVMQQLVLHAVQSMPAGGRVTLAADNIMLDGSDALPLKPGRYVKISVTDTGAGMSEQELAKVFEPYATKSKSLGLTMAQAIVHQHGGYIAVTSKINAGTTFFFYLPVSAKVPAAPPAQAAHPPPAAGAARILIMDDEPAIRHLLARTLEKDGFEVAAAARGEEAVALFDQARRAGRPFDAVILDLIIADGMGGVETLARLRELDPGVKAVVSSGYSTDVVLSDHRAHGFAGMIAKPYRQEELLAVLRRVLAGAS